MSKRKFKNLVAIFLPLVVISFWVVSLSWHTQSKTEVLLAVEGLDPRDLLSGHYLSYRVRYGKRPSCPTRQKPWCACLVKRSDGISEAESFGECSGMNCRGVILKGRCDQKVFLAGIERYYFPEVHRKRLRVVPPSSTVRVRVDSSGRGLVTEFAVDGTALIDWLKKEEKNRGHRGY